MRGRWITQMAEREGFALQLYDLKRNEVRAYFRDAEVAEDVKEVLNAREARADAEKV